MPNERGIMDARWWDYPPAWPTAMIGYDLPSVE
jgi:hypothetical protein